MNPLDRERDTDPALSALLESAYAETVDMDVAARHLWVIHRAAGAMRGHGRRTRKALVSVLAGGMFFMSSGGALAASSNALPGDMLYGVKRGVETARIVLTVSKEGDARLYIALAKRRMAEASQVLEKRPEAVPNLVREALDSLDSAERTGGTQVAMEVQAAKRETTEQLDVLVAVLDENAADLIEPKKTLDEATEIALIPSSPSATPTEAAAESPSATPSQDAGLASAEASPSTTPEAGSESPSPSDSETATVTPSPSTSPTEDTSASPSASASPSESESASASPSPSQTASPSEPTPTSSPTRKYESVEPSEAPTGTDATAAAPTPSETPST